MESTIGFSEAMWFRRGEQEPAHSNVPAEAPAARVPPPPPPRPPPGDRRNGIGGVPTIEYDRSLVPGLLPEPDLRELAALSASGR